MSLIIPFTSNATEQCPTSLTLWFISSFICIVTVTYKCWECCSENEENVVNAQLETIIVQVQQLSRDVVTIEQKQRDMYQENLSFDMRLREAPDFSKLVNQQKTLDSLARVSTTHDININKLKSRLQSIENSVKNISEKDDGRLESRVKHLEAVISEHIHKQQLAAIKII